MDKMDSISTAFIEGRFDDIFEAARSNALRPEQVVAYSQSLAKLRETRRGIAYAAETAREEGRKEGREEGIAEGKERGREEMIRKKAAAGLDDSFIAGLAQITPEELCNSPLKKKAEALLDFSLRIR